MQGTLATSTIIIADPGKGSPDPLHAATAGFDRESDPSWSRTAVSELAMRWGCR
jgi:hypothetical protein